MMNLILFVIAVLVAYKVYENIIKFGCKCENCGKNIKCDDQFCIYCGAKVNYLNGETTNSHTTSQKQYYNYYEILDDLDGVIVSLMAKVAKSDGVISSQEATYISQRYVELADLTHKSHNVIDIFEEIFDREKEIKDYI